MASNQNLAVQILINATDNASRAFSTIQENAGKLAIAVAGIFAKKSLDDAAAFEFQLDKVAAKGGYTSEEMAKLTEFAKGVGTAFGKSGTESAQGLEILAAAGLSASSAMKTLPSILALAKIEGTSMDVASQGLTDTLTIMGLGFEEAGRAADVLSKGANLSTTSVVDLENAFSYAGTQAKNSGLSFEETTAVLDVLAGAGLRGERAGTGLRAVLEELQKPTSKAREELQKMGINTSNLTDVMEQLRINGAEKSKSAILAFGTVAGPTVQALMKKGADGIDEYSQKLQDSKGFATQAAETMGTNFTSALDRLGAVFTNLRAEFALPFLEPLTKGANALASTISNNVPQAIHLLEGLAAIIGVQMVKSAAALATAFGATATGASILSARIIALAESVKVALNIALPFNRMIGLLIGLGVVEAITSWAGAFDKLKIGALNVAQGLIAVKETVVSFFSGDFFTEKGKASYDAKIKALEQTFDEFRQKIIESSQATEEATQNHADAIDNQVKAVDEFKKSVEEFAQIQIERLKETTTILQDEYKLQTDSIKNELDLRIVSIKNHQKSIEDGEQQIYEATKKSQEKQLDEVEYLADKRIEVTKEVYEKGIELTKEGTTERKDIEQQYSQELADIESERVTNYQSTMSSMIQAAENFRDKSVQYANQVLGFEQEKANAIREFDRIGMTDAEAVADRKKEIDERLTQFKKLMEEGRYDEALKYAEKTKKLAEDLTKEFVDEDGKVVSSTKAKYISAVDQAKEAANALSGLNKEHSEDMISRANSVGESLDTATSKLTDINTELAKKHFLAIEADAEQVKEAKRLIDEIPTEKHITLYATTIQENANGGQIQYFATGGQPEFVRREGGLGGYGGGDTVPAMLEPGEWIIKKESVNKYGNAFMAQLNAGKIEDIPRFRTGGRVDDIKERQDSYKEQIDELTKEMKGMQSAGDLGSLSWAFYNPFEAKAIKDSYNDKQRQIKKLQQLLVGTEDEMKTAQRFDKLDAEREKRQKEIDDENKRIADEQRRRDDEIYKQKEQTLKLQGDDAGLENLRYEREKQDLAGNAPALQQAAINNKLALAKIQEEKQKKAADEAKKLADEKKKADDEAQKLKEQQTKESDRLKIDGFKLKGDEVGLENFNYEKEKQSLSGNSEALKQAELNHQARLEKLKQKENPVESAKATTTPSLQQQKPQLTEDEIRFQKAVESTKAKNEYEDEIKRRSEIRESEAKARQDEFEAKFKQQEQSSTQSSSIQTITIQFVAPSGKSASGSFAQNDASAIVDILREAAESGSTFDY